MPQAYRPPFHIRVPINGSPIDPDYRRILSLLIAGKLFPHLRGKRFEFLDQLLEGLASTRKTPGDTPYRKQTNFECAPIHFSPILHAHSQMKIGLLDASCSSSSKVDRISPASACRPTAAPQGRSAPPAVALGQSKNAIPKANPWLDLGMAPAPESNVAHRISTVLKRR